MIALSCGGANINKSHDFEEKIQVIMEHRIFNDEAQEDNETPQASPL